MTHTHAPGPWRVTTKGSKHFIDGADGLTVAYLDRAGARVRGEIDANARLLASAPCLLAALQDAEFLLRKVATNWKESGSMVDSFARSAADARAAIAKATGGAA